MQRAFIPEQFTVKAHPDLFEGEGGGGRGKKIEEHFSQLTQTCYFTAKIPSQPKHYFTLKLRHLDIFNMGYGSSQHIELLSKKKYFDKNMIQILKILSEKC